ncbi:MAG: hypothetical protein KatS3mg102_1485 [Planctomycetota bacterium]|nr:MAG: hypothetical protein KatS3mg102_1485 [Planctomycetota bacterium]
MRGAGWRGLTVVVRLVVREHAAGYCMLGMVVALGAAAVGLGTPQLEPGGEARLALVYGLGATELLVVLAAALLGALSLGTTLRRRRAAALLARPLGRAALLAGHALGALCVAALVALVAGATLLGALLASGHGRALGALVPRVEHLPAEVLVGDREGRPVPAPPAFALQSGENALWRFRGIPPAAGRTAAAWLLQVAPAYAAREGFPGAVEVALAVRMRPAPPPGDPDRGWVHSRHVLWCGRGQPGLLALPMPGAASGHGGETGAGPPHDIEVLLEVRTPDSMLAFELQPPAGQPVGEQGPNSGMVTVRGAERSPAAGLVALGVGRLGAGAVVAALGVLGAAVVREWTAALAALVLAALARFPELVRTFALSVQALGTHAHPEPLASAPAPAWWAVALQRLAEGVAGVLPELGRLDWSGAVLAGRPVALAAVARELAALLPFLGGIAVLAWGAFIRRDVRAA